MAYARTWPTGAESTEASGVAPRGAAVVPAVGVTRTPWAARRRVKARSAVPSGSSAGAPGRARAVATPIAATGSV